MIIRQLNGFYFVAMTLICLSNLALAQSVVEELESPSSINRGFDDVTFAEKIVVASKSKRIFILTNNNQSLEPGDFVTMLIGEQKIIRGLIAKSRQGKSAFKVLKTYNDQAKLRLKRGMTVRLYRGDDTQLSVTSNEPNIRINSEADLFSDSVLFEEEDKKVKEVSSIKNNNIIQFGYGVLNSIDENGGSTNHSHFIFSWNYRLKELVWIESVFGYSTAKRFPAQDISTDLFNLTVRGKYTYELPFYSYLMPYAGLQIVIASSPEAGQDTTPAQAAIELDLVDDAEKITPVVGVTYMKRFVPSWFLTANLGLDVMSVGLAIEF